MVTSISGAVSQPFVDVQSLHVTMVAEAIELKIDRTINRVKTNCFDGPEEMFEKWLFH
jgi:hypothetical protein